MCGMEKIDPADTDHGLLLSLGTPTMLGQTLACIYLLSELLPILINLRIKGADQVEGILKVTSTKAETRLPHLAVENPHIPVDTVEVMRSVEETLNIWRKRLYDGF
jgi:hypothetical protein